MSMLKVTTLERESANSNKWVVVGLEKLPLNSSFALPLGERELLVEEIDTDNADKTS
jgi:hypothetical protein